MAKFISQSNSKNLSAAWRSVWIDQRQVDCFRPGRTTVFTKRHEKAVQVGFVGYKTSPSKSVIFPFRIHKVCTISGQTKLDCDKYVSAERPFVRHIHQMWNTPDVPDKYTEGVASCKRLNPDYNYTLWLPHQRWDETLFVAEKNGERKPEACPGLS